MGTTVVWINAESSLLTRVVDSNRVLGRALFLNSKRVRPGSQETRLSVTNSANLASEDVSEEGALRGDKGAKVDTDVDQNQYLMRALALAKGEAYLLTGAFICLGLSSVSSLILPSYQGRILDHVINRAVALFRRDVLLLVAFSFFYGSIRGCPKPVFCSSRKACVENFARQIVHGHYHSRYCLF
jgi:hypothetical protein